PYATLFRSGGTSRRGKWLPPGGRPPAPGAAADADRLDPGRGRPAAGSGAGYGRGGCRVLIRSWPAARIVAPRGHNTGYSAGDFALGLRRRAGIGAGEVIRIPPVASGCAAPTRKYRRFAGRSRSAAPHPLA